MKRINLLIASLALLTLFMTASCTRISPGYAGFKINYSGDYRGTDSVPLETGWVGYMPGFSTVVSFPTYMQHIIWTKDSNEGSEKNEELSIGCKGGAGLLLDIGLNYTILPQKVSHIYFKFKTDDLESLNNGYIRNSARKILNDLAGTYTVDSFLTYRPIFERTAESNLRDYLASDGIIVSQLSILTTPRTVDPQLQASIDAKIKAKQDAETSQTLLQKTQAEAQMKIAAAQGDSSVIVINANAQAEANNKLQQTLTPLLIQKIYLEKWDGQLPNYMLGNSNSNLLLNLPK